MSDDSPFSLGRRHPRDNSQELSGEIGMLTFEGEDGDTHRGRHALQEMGLELGAKRKTVKDLKKSHHDNMKRLEELEHKLEDKESALEKHVKDLEKRIPKLPDGATADTFGPLRELIAPFQQGPIFLAAASVVGPPTTTPTVQAFAITVQQPLQVERFVVSMTDGANGATVGPNSNLGTVEKLAVGQINQYAVDGSVPATLFAPQAVGVKMNGNTAKPGVNINIALGNYGTTALVAFGGVVGRSVALQ